MDTQTNKKKEENMKEKINKKKDRLINRQPARQGKKPKQNNPVSQTLNGVIQKQQMKTVL